VPRQLIARALRLNAPRELGGKPHGRDVALGGASHDRAHADLRNGQRDLLAS
jgi:hypothetical protein